MPGGPLVRLLRPMRGLDAEALARPRPYVRPRPDAMTPDILDMTDLSGGVRPVFAKPGSDYEPVKRFGFRTTMPRDTALRWYREHGNAPGPRKNYNLGWLDMSEAERLRRAQEMGFDTDTVFWHGSTQKLKGDRFDPAHEASRYPQTYFTSHPPKASNFGGYAYPVHLRTDRLLDFRKPEHKQVIGEILEEVGESLEGSHINLYTDSTGLPNWSWWERFPGAKRREIAEAAKKRGYDGVFLKDEYSDEAAIWNQSAIRHIGAIFDPAQKDSDIIFAGLRPGRGQQGKR